MPQAVESVTLTVEQLTEHLQNLERRVAALEKSEAAVPEATTSVMVQTQPTHPQVANWGFPPLDGAAGILATLGKAVLGMAGAYLLRALAETSSIPKLPLLIIAILYACFWMVWAARVHVASRFASATYALTSVLILSPLLWESTVRFQSLSITAASFCIVALVVLALGLAWRSELQMVPWIATTSSIATAMVLIIETQDLAPVATAILALALLIEAAVCMGVRQTVRVLPALAAGFAVWLMAYLMTRSEGVPEGYHVVSPSTITAVSVALMGIYAASVAIRGFVWRNRISLVDIVQTALAFAVGCFGILRAGREASATALGIVFLVCAVICYWSALVRFAQESHNRNRRISVTWALGLLLTATLLVFPPTWQASFLSLAALGAAFLYDRTGKLSIGIHASIFLAAAVAMSPMIQYLAGALAGTVPSVSDWRIWVIAVSAALCYWIGSHHAEIEAKKRLLWILPVLLLGFAIAALLISATVMIGGHRIDSQASVLSVVRTITNCGLALAYGFLGGRFKRVELTWAAYATVGFGTVKLLLEDLRYGNAESLVFSLLFYGLVLILLPRMARRMSETTM